MNILKKAFTTSRDGFMPSVFSQLDSKMSRPLSCRQELEDLILRNHELAAITESYRKALAVSKQLADSKVKPLSTGICFAAQLDGRGRLLENVMGEVGCLGLDYDHLSSETMGILFELIRHSPHVLIAYRTITAMGCASSWAISDPRDANCLSWNCTRQCCRRRWRCSTPCWASRPTGSA